MGTTIVVYRELSKNISIQLPIRKSYQLGRSVAPIAGWRHRFKLRYGDDLLYLFGWPSPRFAAAESRDDRTVRHQKAALFFFPKSGIHAILLVMMIEMPNRAEMLLRACRAKVRGRREPSDGAVAGKLGIFALQESELMQGSYFSQTVPMLQDEPALHRRAT
jgi:hypothetical protein